jgi:pimeloyl-ACP methyl ester carboxylesterase
VTILAGSNGCSVAVRLTLAFPDRIERLLLAWPATANDPTVDAQSRAGLTELDASPEVVDALLTGQTLRGVTDDELATLRIPVGMLPSVPENPFHQRHTVDALRRLLPRADELPGCPEPPHPGFPPHTESFVSTVTGFAPR